jgi:hypothetical protein
MNKINLFHHLFYNTNSITNKKNVFSEEIIVIVAFLPILWNISTLSTIIEYAIYGRIFTQNLPLWGFIIPILSIFIYNYISSVGKLKEISKIYKTYSTEKKDRIQFFFVIYYITSVIMMFGVVEYLESLQVTNWKF